MSDEKATYRVYYEDDEADPYDPPFIEILAFCERGALTRAWKIDDKSFTHAEFYEPLDEPTTTQQKKEE